MVVLPAALVCIAQGLIYGIFSKWGFVKCKWILAKWIMVIVVVLCTGMGGIGQMFVIFDHVQNNNMPVVTLHDGKFFLCLWPGKSRRCAQ
jgi:hypothetical protein